MKLNTQMEQYAADITEEVKQFIRELAVIPAPSHHEEQRAAHITDAFRFRGVDVSAELLGERPCGAEIPGYEAFLAPIFAAGREILGRTLQRTSGSSDANYPLSLGIPAVCIGGCDAEKWHTRQEYLHTDTLTDGLRFVMAVMAAYFQEN